MAKATQLFPGLLDAWRYASSKYYTLDSAVDYLTAQPSFAPVAKDPDISAALSAIRNAERAIEARMRELDADDSIDD